jgi:hypothetical protein
MEKNFGKIELFAEKTGDIVRIIRFHNQKEFTEFLNAFNKMRYPGYGWRFKDKVKTKMKINE